MADDTTETKTETTADETAQHEDAPKPAPPASEPTESGEKRFTQAEVDAIIAKRLARAKGSDDDLEDLRKRAAEADDLRAKLDALDAQTKRAALVKAVADEAGVPESILASVNADDEDGLKAAAQQLVDWAKTQKSTLPPAAADPDATPRADWVDQLFGD